jgi:hypothetical protein
MLLAFRSGSQGEFFKPLPQIIAEMRWQETLFVKYTTGVLDQNAIADSIQFRNSQGG